METDRLFLVEDQSDSRRYIIIEKVSKEEIGHIAVYDDSEENRADTRELGYAIKHEYRRKGYMQEALKAILTNLFENNIKYVWACCVQTNIPSKNLIEKMGFQLVKEGMFDEIGNRKEVPSFEYIMTQELWFKEMEKII